MVGEIPKLGTGRNTTLCFCRACLLSASRLLLFAELGNDHVTRLLIAILLDFLFCLNCHNSDKDMVQSDTP